MSEALSELRDELRRRGIRLERRGKRLWIAPRAAVTDDLVERISSHKNELLMVLGKETDTNGDGESSGVHAQRELIDPPDPCPSCNSLMLWQTLAGNWRCQGCDPPHTSRRLRQEVSQILAERAIQNSADGRCGC